jgi:hypothetical protein
VIAVLLSQRPQRAAETISKYVCFCNKNAGVSGVLGYRLEHLAVRFG